MSQPLLSICIPTYNRGTVLAARVAAFLRETDSEEVEVVVSDNASSDGTPEAFSALRDPRLTFLRQTENVGNFENQLRAFAAARGRWLLQVTDKDAVRAVALPAALTALSGLQAGCGGFVLHGTEGRKAAAVTCWRGRAAYARVGLAFAHPSGRFFRSDILRSPGLLERHRSLDAVTRPYSTDYLTSFCLATGAAYAHVSLPFVQHNLPPYEGVTRSFSYGGRRDYYFTPEFVFDEFLHYVRFMKGELRLPLLVRLAAVFGVVRRSLMPRMTAVYRSILENPDICAWYGVDDDFRRRELARDLEGEFLARARTVSGIGGIDALAVRRAIAGCRRRMRHGAETERT